MILKAITIHDKFIIILSRYIVCLDVCHALHDAHLVARIPRYSWIRVYNESKGDSSNFLENDNALSLYCSLKEAPKLLTIHLPSKQETFWPLPLISLPDTIEFIPSGANTQKKEILPYPICSVVAVLKMLIRILDTLRSRIWDMDYFFFLCFGSRRNEFNSLWIEMGEKSEDYCLLRRYIIQKIIFSLFNEQEI